MISWLQISTQDSFLNESYSLFPAFFFFLTSKNAQDSLQQKRYVGMDLR